MSTLAPKKHSARFQLHHERASLTAAALMKAMHVRNVDAANENMGSVLRLRWLSPRNRLPRNADDCRDCQLQTRGSGHRRSGTRFHFRSATARTETYRQERDPPLQRPSFPNRTRRLTEPEFGNRRCRDMGGDVRTCSLTSHRAGENR